MITEETLGKDHPQYSTIMTNLAVLLEKQVRAGMSRGHSDGSLKEVDLLTFSCCCMPERLH